MTNNTITIRPSSELYDKLTKSAKIEHRTRHNYIIKVLEMNEQKKIPRDLFSIKLSDEEKSRLRRELGL